MIGMVILEGFGLAALLVLICAFGIRRGAVGMVHLYHQDVQDRCVELGLTTHEKIAAIPCSLSSSACRGIWRMCSCLCTQ